MKVVFQKKVKCLIHWTTLFKYLVYILFIINLSSQDGEIISLSKHIGHTLDAEENLYYNVFSDIPNFNNAQFFQLKPNLIIARISYIDYTKIKITRKSYNLKKFTDLQITVNKMPKITNEIRESFADNLTYLRTRKVLENIPTGQFVSVKIRSNKWVKGTLLSFKKNTLSLQTPISIKKIPITQMERINYREKIINRPDWKIYFYGIAAIIGFTLMETWNHQTTPEWGIKWHNRFSGAIFGLVAGAEVYDTSMILLSKKTQFGLSSKELDKLKLN